MAGCSYVGFTGGYSGESEAPNYSIEYTLDERRPTDPNWLMVSGGVVYIDNGLKSPWVNIGPEIGSFIKLGIEVVPDSGIFANVLGGLTFQSWSSVWEQDQMEIDGMYGGGLTYFIKDGGTAIIASYDNKRGVSAGVGFRY